MLSGGLNGNISVVCGSHLAAKTTSTKIPTTTATFTTRLLRASSEVSSSYSEVTMSTAAILSEEIDCDRRIGTFFLIYNI